MEQTTAYRIGALVGGLVVGVLCGLAPLLIGRKRNRQALGKVGLIACIVSGLILGLILAIPVSIIFTMVIFFSKPPATDDRRVPPTRFR